MMNLKNLMSAGIIVLIILVVLAAGYFVWGQNILTEGYTTNSMVYPLPPDSGLAPDGYYVVNSTTMARLPSETEASVLPENIPIGYYIINIDGVDMLLKVPSGYVASADNRSIILLDNSGASSTMSPEKGIGNAMLAVALLLPFGILEALINKLYPDGVIFPELGKVGGKDQTFTIVPPGQNIVKNDGELDQDVCLNAFSNFMALQTALIQKLFPDGVKLQHPTFGEVYVGPEKETELPPPPIIPQIPGKFLINNGVVDYDILFQSFQNAFGYLVGLINKLYPDGVNLNHPTMGEVHVKGEEISSPKMYYDPNIISSGTETSSSRGGTSEFTPSLNGNDNYYKPVGSLYTSEVTSIIPTNAPYIPGVNLNAYSTTNPPTNKLLGGFCDQLTDDIVTHENKCNSFDSSVCASTKCCVLAGGTKCTAGNKYGPLLKNIYADPTVKNKQIYYYMGKCYGNCY